MINLLIMGKPGAGKGTQARKLLKHYHLYHISTGNIYRKEIKNNTEIGIMARKYLADGHLVPDKMTNDIVRNVLGTQKYPHGFMLDGYPRTDAQADALDQMLDEMGLHLTAIINVDVSDDVLIHRITGRRVCPNCAQTYHVENNKPEADGICDKCNTPLIQREDDSEAAVMNRLKAYNLKTKPLLEHYEKKGLLVEIDGNRPVMEVYNDILKIIGEE